ncbi:tyrosine-type recombinase/integrase [Nocardia sp. NPDC058633]|uniref:tyrosine-type recombinase/integrase n=1 Tax=Nocardia sp. NPDC058633 TaxID=3346568 RepID=UPI003665DDB0
MSWWPSIGAYAGRIGLGNSVQQSAAWLSFALSTARSRCCGELSGAPAARTRLDDKGTKGNRRRYVPLIEEVRQLVLDRIAVIGEDNTDARLFVGPRGGRIATGVLRDATHWDEVVTKLGYEHLRRHDLRHTGLTWMTDAGVSLHLLQKIAGHADS